MQSILSPGKKGKVKVEFYTITESESISTLEGPFTPPGNYVSLFINNKRVMTDEPYEHYTNIEVVDNAKGNILIAGLGLGMILTRILPKNLVKSVIVIEKNKDVIDLILPYLVNIRGYKKLLVVNEDIFNFSTKLRTMDCIYHDITFDGNIKQQIQERKRLNKYLSKFLTPNGWLGQWESAQWEEVLDQEK